MVWAPVKFAAGWDLAVHIVDIISLSLLSLLSAGTMSPVLCLFHVSVYLRNVALAFARGFLDGSRGYQCVHHDMYVYVAFGPESPTPEWEHLPPEACNLAAIAD